MLPITKESVNSLKSQQCSCPLSKNRKRQGASLQLVLIRIISEIRHQIHHQVPASLTLPAFDPSVCVLEKSLVLFCFRKGSKNHTRVKLNINKLANLSSNHHRYHGEKSLSCLLLLKKSPGTFVTTKCFLESGG